ncbi:MAG: Ig-like domain-containing protein, partial [Candidatus Aminicenantes bacterium]|nr:Ig-like domain-containing protein [Candidatus Aminicenantes bacterium]
MRKKLALFFVAISLIFLDAAVVSCKKKEKARPAERLVTEVKGELRVLQVSPKGPTQTSHEAEEIVVIFDHPMVALEPLPREESSSLLKFDPPFSGKSRWMGTKTLVFSPKNRFPFATEIKAVIPAGTRSLDGYVLKEDYQWTWTTIRPRLLRHFPQNQQRQLRLET